MVCCISDMRLIFETGIVEACYLGAQRQVLSTIEMQGSNALLHPLDVHSLCIQVGLLPKPVEMASINPSVVC